MEMSKPLDNGKGKPMQEWETTFHPSYNSMHELDLCCHTTAINQTTQEQFYNETQASRSRDYLLNWVEEQLLVSTDALHKFN
eukprot:12584186-Ditylum_brightwellii.AAC.2